MQCRDPPKGKNISFLELARSSAKQLQPLAKCSLVSPASLPNALPTQPIAGAMLECSGPIGLLSASAPAS